MLSVTDRGPGVPAEHRELVLQRYKRLDSSRRGKGSGLGLALVAAIARRHRARLTLADAAPGLTVTLTFAVQSTQ
jgi:signal transduction histidine kinase